MPQNEDLNALEARLAALRPRTGLDRDRLMFLAGRASGGAGILPVRCGASVQPSEDNSNAPAASPAGTTAPQSRRRWAWPAATAGMTALAASLLIALLVRPQPQPIVQIVERIVEVPAVRPAIVAGEPRPRTEAQDTVYRQPSAADRLPASSYPRMRDQMLAMGVDSWRTQQAGPEERRQPPRESYRELRELLLGPPTR
jgi:hypothetical protein